ncbi:MAG: DUF547 domain-containing protein [Acidobacteriota bacterium]|nr:DUF547 domain-containing protein [Acidobacteriota bacterium]
MRLISVSIFLLAALSPGPFLARSQGDVEATAASSCGENGDTALSSTATSLSIVKGVCQSASTCNQLEGGIVTGESPKSAAFLKPKQELSRRSWAEVGADQTLYDPWARVLSGYVDEEGLVDYTGLRAEGYDDLKTFIETIGSTDPSGFSETGQLTFWINAYNAITVYQVVQRYPIENVREVGILFGLVGGFFKQEYRVANRELTLDNIEHDILRPTYNDPRIHWALVCAAFGCPRLLRRPYVATDVDLMLTELSFEFMASPRAMYIDDDNVILWVSSYFDWYGGDFEVKEGNIIDYILVHAPADKAAWIREHRDTMRVQFIDYDWTLNDQVKGPRNQRPIRTS